MIFTNNIKENTIINDEFNNGSMIELKNDGNFKINTLNNNTNILENILHVDNNSNLKLHNKDNNIHIGYNNQNDNTILETDKDLLLKSGTSMCGVVLKNEVVNGQHYRILILKQI